MFWTMRTACSRRSAQSMLMRTEFSVRLGTRMLPAVTYGVAADGTGPSGFPSFGYALPSWDSTSGTNLAVSTDFINQVLFAFFEGGLLNRTLTSEDLGLDAATISL